MRIYPKFRFWILVPIVMCASVPAQQAGTVGVQAVGRAYKPLHSFDLHRDAKGDISEAISQAERTHKRIILYVGGDWCPYCDQLGQMYQKNPDVLALRDANFITVYIYYGTETHNPDALAKYGKVIGVPHYFVLDTNGELLQSQHMTELRAHATYDPGKVREFLEHWAPRAQTTINVPEGEGKRD